MPNQALHSSAAELYSRTGAEVWTCVDMSPCHDLSVRPSVQTQPNPNFALLQPLTADENSLWLQTLSGLVGVPAWVWTDSPHGCSRSPLNKAAVLLLSTATSLVSNEHLPGSFQQQHPCQQPRTLICPFITPKRCVSRKRGGGYNGLAETLLPAPHKQCVFGTHRCVCV